MVNSEEGAIAPPPVRPLVAIVSCEWKSYHVLIAYHCACSNLVHIRAYENRHAFTHAQPLNASVEKRHPTVKMTWKGGRVDIESKCVCEAGCRFTREDGGSGVLQVIP